MIKNRFQLIKVLLLVFTIFPAPGSYSFSQIPNEIYTLSVKDNYATFLNDLSESLSNKTIVADESRKISGRAKTKAFYDKIIFYVNSHEIIIPYKDLTGKYHIENNLRAEINEHQNLTQISIGNITIRKPGYNIRDIFQKFTQIQNYMFAEECKYLEESFKKDFNDQFKKGDNEITEEQRKLIVQANALSENKDYINAIILYQKAMEINPFSYPDAYHNLSVLFNGLGTFRHNCYAVLNLKKYILLIDDDDEKRKAQDRIYELEILMYGNKNKN